MRFAVSTIGQRHTPYDAVVVVVSRFDEVRCA